MAHALLKAEGFQVESGKGALNESELISKLADFHILGIRSKTQVQEKFLSQAKRLLSVGCFCIGTNQVDLLTAKRQGIAVFNAPFSNTRSVAELIMAEIVMLSRKLGDRNMEMHRGDWVKSAVGCFEVRGKTLGIIGYGHIGSQVSVLAESFGMKVQYFDILTKMPMGNSRQVFKLDELLSQSDFVTLHVPETPQTQRMISASQLAQMKKGAYLLNASRGSVVDLEALSAALKSGAVAGCALDVFPEEPEGNLDKFKIEFQGHPNVIMTPHIGGSTEEAQENIGIEVAQSFIKFINNGSTSGSVNFPNVDLPVKHEGHRILNVHKNVPGVLKEINRIISDLGANITGQYLATDSEIGYLIIELDHLVSERAKDEISKLPASIRTRILY